MSGLPTRALGAILPALLLGACARYEAIPWREAPGRPSAVPALGERLVAGLEEGLKGASINVGRLRAIDPRAGEGPPVLRAVVVGFPEARTGLRTVFSRRVEEAVRRALGRSARFVVVDGGEGLAWQEARGSAALPPLDEEDRLGLFDNVAIGEWREAALARKQAGHDQEAAPEVFSRELDEDHPLRGLWLQARGGAYGEESAVYVASIFEADVAVLGAYALGPGRVRVWAAVVLNSPPRRIYFARGLSDIFGEPERAAAGRIYPAYARDALPRSAVPNEDLTTGVAPRPRRAPRHPPFWGEPALEVALEEIDGRGNRKRLAGGNLVRTDSLVVGRLAVRLPRHVYAFALNEKGEAEEIFASQAPGQQGRAAPVRPGRFVPFSARLVEPRRMYRLYFVSSQRPFEGARAVQAARRRLGLGPESPAGLGRRSREMAQVAPPSPWFVAGGQERLILEEDWDQQVFWLFRQGPG